jgi:hypothetical protein
MGTEMVPETSVSSYNQLTWLIAREDFIEFSLRENFKSYNNSSFCIFSFRMILSINSDY